MNGGGGGEGLHLGLVNCLASSCTLHFTSHALALVFVECFSK